MSYEMAFSSVIFFHGLMLGWELTSEGLVLRVLKWAETKLRNGC